MAGTDIYIKWSTMKRRCDNKNTKDYPHYGGRGIAYCDRWKLFSNFYEDMGDSYQEGLSLDRREPNGNYEPGNCRWVELKIQKQNTRILKCTNTSGYRGVTFKKAIKKFCAQINVDGSKKHIGTFLTAEEAGRAYDNYVTENQLHHTKNEED